MFGFFSKSSSPFLRPESSRLDIYPSAPSSDSETLIGSESYPLGLTWQRVRSSSGPKRSLCALVVFPDDEILIFGGWEASRGRTAEVLASTDGGSTWKVRCDSPGWSPRIQSAAVVSGRRVFLLGGDDGDYRSDIWASDDRGRNFRLVLSSAPWQGRAGFGAAADSVGNLLVLGGRTVGDPLRLLNDVWRSTDAGLTWNCVHVRSPWTPRTGFLLLCCRDDQGLLLIGGQTTDSLVREIWSSADFGSSWKKRQLPTAAAVRSEAVGVFDGASDEVLVLGGTGETGKVLKDVWSSADAGTTWKRRPDLPTDDRVFAAAVVSRGKLLLLGGENSWGETSAEIWKSAPEASQARASARTLVRVGVKLPLPVAVWKQIVIPFLLHINLILE